MRSCTKFICFFLTGCLLIAPFMSKAQTKKAKKAFDEAQPFYNAKQFNKAIPLLKSAVNEDSTFTIAWAQLGDLYSSMDSFSKANRAYRTMLRLDPTKGYMAWLRIGQMEILQSNYAQAEKDFAKVLSYKNLSFTADYEGQLGLASAKLGQKLMANPMVSKGTPLPSSINSKAQEYMPSLPADGSSISFTRIEEPKLGGENIYLAEAGANGWQTAKPLPSPPNSMQNEGAHILSADGRILIFTGCDKPGGFGMCDLYWSEKQVSGWSEPKNLGEIINSPAWESQPTLSGDGSVLIFASTRTGGQGGSDLWEATLQENGIWTNPRPLTELNTRKDERTPYFHPDGKTLYFSSNGWPGLGLRDLFYSKKLPSGEWSEPVNLGYPINDARDQASFFVTASGETAYYASEREGQNLDLFEMNLPQALRPEPVSYVKGVIIDGETQNPVEGMIYAAALETGRLEYAGKSLKNGAFLLPLPAGERHVLDVAQKGYMLYSEAIMATDGKTPITKNIVLQPIHDGATVSLNNLLFATNSASLSDNSKLEIAQIASFLKNNPLLIVEIRGHTDNVGTVESNKVLSGKRAEAVQKALIAKGINEKRIRVRGFGAELPIASNKTLEGQQLNRRTELVVLSSRGEMPAKIAADKKIASSNGWEPVSALYSSQRLYVGAGVEKGFYGMVLGFRKNPVSGIAEVFIRTADAELSWKPETEVLATPQLFMMKSAEMEKSTKKRLQF